MTMSLQEISDRMEIQDLLVSYSYALEAHNWDALDDVFTPDALIDYSEEHGSTGDLATTKQFMAALDQSTIRIPVHGGDQQDLDRWRHRHGAQHPPSPVLVDVSDGRTHVYFCGNWYARPVRPHAERMADQGAGDGALLLPQPAAELAFLQDQHDDDCACIEAWAARGASLGTRSHEET